MKTLKQLYLSENEKEALAIIKKRVSIEFNSHSFIIFGSTVNGTRDNESDVDILIITNHKLDRTDRHRITDIIFEINLAYETNFSTLVVDNDSWSNGPISALPIHEEIIRQGVRV